MLFWRNLNKDYVYNGPEILKPGVQIGKQEIQSKVNWCEKIDSKSNNFSDK